MTQYIYAQMDTKIPSLCSVTEDWDVFGEEPNYDFPTKPGDAGGCGWELIGPPIAVSGAKGEMWRWFFKKELE